VSGYDLPTALSDLISDLGHEDDRLRGAVYFGYGIMNIVLSLIPPKLMKLANLFGFSGNRRLGLQALEFSSHSQDMKAPLARIALLWYHTIVRPFFALDGEREEAGAEEADRLLMEAESLYPNSALFLYFRGKVLYLRHQLDDALVVYTSAAALSKSQREIEHIALYEKGWIHFLQLNYAEALPCYTRLKNETRWSACFYAYLCALMTGVMGDLRESRELFLQSSRLVKRKNNNLEKFCHRRAQLYKKGVTFHMPLEARLMIMEVFYLWRALPFCSDDAKLQMMEMLDLALPSDAQPFHKAMRAWLRGGVLNSLKRPREAEKSLREALQYEPDIKQDKHIISFSLYEIAMIHIANTEYAKARTLLHFAKDAYTGYEFEARLNFKVHSALSSLR
jgi:tetratricopeptide (TPR) repeat protein